MATVKIYTDPFREKSETHNFKGSLGAFLFEKYDQKPEWQIVKNGVDITGDVDELLKPAKGNYEVIIWAGYIPIPFTGYLLNLIAIGQLTAIGYGLYSIGAGLLGKGIDSENNRLGSQNNSLSGRTNTERPLQRIEDIYGTVRSYPTLIAVPYREYISNDEYEFSYMSIGRGYFDISDVRDSDTLLSSISGAGASFYNPDTSPNSGDSPFLEVGTGPTSPIYTVTRSNSVDGATLQAPNELSHQGNADVTFTTNKTIAQSGDTDFLDFLEVGDTFTVTNSGSNDGTYTVATVTSSTITTVQTTISNESNSDAIIQKVGAADDVWIGPFILEDAEQVWCNIVLPNGLFKQKDKKETATCSGTIEVQAVDETDTPTGSAETTNWSFSAKTQDAQRKTIKITPSFSGRMQVRVSRTNNTDYAFEGTVIDEAKWQDLYGVKNVVETDFGDITTVHTVTKATDSALRVKNRKFNCLAQRKLPDYSTGTATTTLTATNDIADILCHMATDSYIGRRTLADIDYENIYDTSAAIKSYFGYDEAAEFCYTFDKDNLTFEEMAQTVATACFCLPYRAGSILRLFFERTQSSSMMLFNHRNKLIDSETRQVSFTPSREYDGVEVTWRDPDNYDSDEVYTTNATAINPKKIQGTGLRNQKQAFWRAWREQYKLNYARIRSEFSSTGEGRALIPGYRIDNVDNTLTRSEDGYIVSQSGLNFELSQPTNLGGTVYINLMNIDGSVEIIECAVVDENTVLLLSSPTSTIYDLTDSGFEPTRYALTTPSTAAALPFIVESVDVENLYTAKVAAINYSANYYSKDTETP